MIAEGFFQWVYVYTWPTIFDNLWAAAFYLAMIGLFFLWLYEKWRYRDRS